MIIEESGKCSLIGDDVSAIIDKKRRGVMTHINSHSSNVPLIMSADALSRWDRQADTRQMIGRRIR